MTKPHPTLTELPVGYLAGHAPGRDLLHLVEAVPFNSLAVCGVDVYDPSLRETLYQPTAVCRKCLALLTRQK